MIGLRRALIALGAAAAAAGAGAVALILTSDAVPNRGLSAFCAVFISWSFVGVGLFAWWRRPHNRFGALMTAVGFAYLLGALRASSVPVLFILGYILGSLGLAVLAHMLLAYPTGRLQGGLDRIVVAGGYLVTTLGSVPIALFWNPDRDLRGTSCDGCPTNPFLVADRIEVARALEIADQVVAAAFAVGLVWLLLRRVRAARGVQRGELAPVLWTGLVAGFVLTVLVAGLAVGAPVELVDAVDFITLIALATVPYAFLFGLLRSRLGRAGAVAELVARLGEAPRRSALRDALAEALDDATLQVVFWLPDPGAHVDSDGRPVAVPPDDGRAVTPVERDGRRVGAILHDPALLEESGLVRAAGAAAALALDNERLEAELRARVEDLRASRTRLVEAGFDERRRVERDLHDGAQQRLVALSLTLGMARSAVAADPQRAGELLAGAQAQLDQALAELRELARGIHPAVLTDHGLEAALQALAGRAPLPVELTGTPDRRLPAAVESAAYFVVAEGLTNVAKYAHASHATVSVARENGRALVEVADDGVGGADPARGTGLRGLADRVAALDGRLAVRSDLGTGTVLRAEIPVP